MNDDEIIQIIILGEFCGKTSLLKRYTKDIFDEKYNSTLGKKNIFKVFHSYLNSKLLILQSRKLN